MPFLCASLKYYPTNNPLEGVCLRPKAGGKPAKKKEGKGSKKNKNASKKNIPISIKIKIDLHQKKYFPGLLWNCPRFQRSTRIKK